LVSSDLRRFAVRRAFPPPGSLQGAIDALDFVQADPIRAPARAQDLTLRQRVAGYRAGDLERQYPTLAVEEDFFINYGFVTRRLQRLMHPRSSVGHWVPKQRTRAAELLAFVQERGAVHPRDVDRHLAHGRVTNFWGGSSSASTHLLQALHYRGALRVVRRDEGIRVYGLQQHGPPPAGRAERNAALDGLVDAAVRKYAPLPAASLSVLVSRIRYAAPQWRRELKSTLARAIKRLSHERVDGINWYWPAGEDAAPRHDEPDERVRLLAPFDPLVWDRRRFELLWQWPYRFEAYTPLAKRKFGYYALPLLWRDDVIGWANVTKKNGRLAPVFGYAGRRPRDAAFSRALDEEVEKLRTFL
jgi:uncharacterized protein YcaQ